MKATRKILFRIASLVLLANGLTLFGQVSSGLAAPSQVEPPPGFTLQRAVPGIELYRKNYSGGSPDFVQVIDLQSGASLQPLHGPVSENRPGAGVYGGDDPRLRSKSLPAYWDTASSQNPNTFCVSNGQFFYMLEYPTRLPFPLKVDNLMVTDGYGINDFPEQKLMLELWSDRADITALDKEALYNSTAPDIIAGLAEDANKRAKHYTGRTFVGVDDRNLDGVFETVLLFNTKTARQVDAAAVLRAFGADKVMMLDGGGSTQLYCQEDWLVYSERLLPQAIAVIAGNEAAAVASDNSLAIPLETPALQVVSPLASATQTTALPTVPPTQTATSPTTTASPQPATPTPSAAIAATITSDSGRAYHAAAFQPATPAGIPTAGMQLPDLIWIPLIVVPGSFIVFAMAMQIRNAN